VDNWREVTIGDIAQVFDGPHATPPETDSGPIFLGISSLNRGRLDLRRSGFLSEDDFLKWTRRVTPTAGDVVFSYETRLGEAAIVPEGLRCCLGRRLALMRPDRSTVEPRFLLYAYLGPDFQEVLRQRTIPGSTVDRIPLNQFRSFPITLPPLAEQRVIADTLGALDDKIESNRRIIDQTESLIAWELDLVTETTCAQMMPVSSIASFVNGGAYTKDATGTGRMVIRINELNGGPGPSTVYNDIDVPEEKLARPGDVLMSWSGSLGVYRWVREEAIINQHIFKVVCTDFPKWFVYDRIQRVMPAFRAIAADKATTMGHIKRHHLDDEFAQVPDAETMSALDRELGPLWERLVLAELESLDLVRLRDTLLPELLAGRLRLPKAKELVESA
jgi:type I restriction enzyme S subunit